MTERLYTTKEAADILGLTQNSVRIYCAKRGICRKMGRDWFLTEKDIAKIAERKGKRGRPKA